MGSGDRQRGSKLAAMICGCLALGFGLVFALGPILGRATAWMVEHGLWWGPVLGLAWSQVVLLILPSLVLTLHFMREALRERARREHALRGVLAHQAALRSAEPPPVARRELTIRRVVLALLALLLLLVLGPFSLILLLYLPARAAVRRWRWLERGLDVPIRVNLRSKEAAAPSEPRREPDALDRMMAARRQAARRR